MSVSRRLRWDDLSVLSRVTRVCWEHPVHDRPTLSVIQHTDPDSLPCPHRDNLSSCTDRHRRGQGDVWVTHEVSELHSGISQVPNEWCPTNLETVMVPSLKFNESRGFTTVWWFDRGMKDIGGSRTLVSNWWLVNSFLDPQKLVDPEKWIGGSGIFVRLTTPSCWGGCVIGGVITPAR